jgi:hypothetical protein
VKNTTTVRTRQRKLLVNGYSEVIGCTKSTIPRCVLVWLELVTLGATARRFDDRLVVFVCKQITPRPLLCRAVESCPPMSPSPGSGGLRKCHKMAIFPYSSKV